MGEPIVPQLTAEEYLSWESRQRDRFELHHGFLVGFAGGTVDHDRVAFRVRIALERAYVAPCRSFGSDVKIQVARDVVYYADAGVLCEPIDGGASIVTRPSVVAEVLSESTRRYDLVDKRSAYRSLPSLATYVVVHTRMRRIEIDTRSGTSWQTSIIDGGTFALGDAEVTLDEIYATSSIGPNA